MPRRPRMDATCGYHHGREHGGRAVQHRLGVQSHRALAGAFRAGSRTEPGGRLVLEANRHGPEIGAEGVRFHLWAPACDRVDLVLCGEPAPLTMNRAAEGWHELVTDRARSGARYSFRLP